MKKSLFFTVVLAASIVFTGSVHSVELILPGSTTIQKRVLEPTAGAIEAATGIKILVRGINTGKGFEALRTGKASASIASSPLDLILEKAGLSNDDSYQEHVIVKDVIVPIVPLSNPVSELTWEQLSDINTGKITNWKEVGGPNRKIIVVTSQPTAATRRVFQALVMKKAPYVKGVREVKSTRREVDLVSKFKGGIGAVSAGFVKMNPGKVKIINTVEISRPLSFITKGEPSADVKAVIDFLMTSQAQKMFK